MKGITQLCTEDRPMSGQVSRFLRPTVRLSLLQVTSCAWVPDGCQLFTGSKCGVITAYSNRFTSTAVGFHGDVPPLTFRLHINTQSTHPLPLPLPPSPTPPLDRITVLNCSASLVTSQLPLKHISTEPTSGIRGLGVQSSERLSDFHRPPPIGI